MSPPEATVQAVKGTAHEASDTFFLLDGDWWTTYGLDGLVPGLIGAFVGVVGTLVAALVAIHVLRQTLLSGHLQSMAALQQQRQESAAQLGQERERTRELLEHDRKQTRNVAARETAGTLLITLADLIGLLQDVRPGYARMYGPPPEADSPEHQRQVRRLYLRMQALTVRLEAETASDWKLFSTTVPKWMNNIRNQTSQAGWETPGNHFSHNMISNLLNLEHDVGVWLRDPDGYSPTGRKPVEGPGAVY